MARTQAVYYRDSRGAEPVDEFIQALPPKRAAKIDEFVEEYLNRQPPQAPPPAFPITSQIEGELRELRVRFANTRYRILYQRSENLVVLLHLLEKDTGSVPQGDIELAKHRHRCGGILTGRACLTKSRICAEKTRHEDAQSQAGEKAAWTTPHNVCHAPCTPESGRSLKP